MKTQLFLVTALAFGVARAEIVSVDGTYALEAGVDYSGTAFQMQGGTLDLNGVTATVGDLSADGAGGTWTNSGDRDAVLTSPNVVNVNNAEVYLSGGQFVFRKCLNVGVKAGAALLDISGDDTRLTVNRSGASYFSDNGIATINVRGGETYFKDSQCLYAASHGTCNLNVSGGLLEMADVLNCWRGTVNLVVSGGTFRPSYLRMGATGDGTGTHTLTQTGGTLDIPSEFTVFNGSASTRTCAVNLNGGAAIVPSIRAKSPTNGGTTIFSADGGLLQPRKAEGDFLSGFQTARLGEKGLTIDTLAYATTVAQSFTGLADGASVGRLMKKGVGALTLTGDIAGGLEVVNDEATTTLSGAIAAGAKLTVRGGELVVGATATVDPAVVARVEAGSLRVNKNLTLAGLFVNPETRANLQLADGVSLTVTKDGGGFTGSLLYSAEDFDVTTDPDGTVHIAKDTRPSGALEIRLDDENAVSNVTESLVFRANETLTASVATGSTLSLDGMVGRGTLVKTGAGTLALTSEDNFFAGGVTLSAGRLVAVSPLALIGSKILQQNGTVDIGSGTATQLGAYELETPAASQAVVFKNDGDITFTTFTHRAGDFIKRGAGTLTIDRAGDKTSDVVLSRDDGKDVLSRTPLTFDDVGGVPPATGFGGFNVAEGEFVLANGSYAFNGHSAMFGMPSTTPLAAPVSFVITNSSVKTSPQGNMGVYLASGLQPGDYGQEVSLRIIDSEIRGDSPFMGGGYENATSTSPEMRITIGVTNSTLRSGWAIPLNENMSGGKTFLWAKDSVFYFPNGGGFRTSGYCELILDNCVYARNDVLDTCSSAMYQNRIYDTGFLCFRNGSRAALGVFGGNGGFFTGEVRFDGATWLAGTGAQMLWHPSDAYDVLIKVKTVGAGVTIPVASGVVNRQTVRLEGDGPLVKTGAGELFFDTRSKWDNARTQETKCGASIGTTTWNFTGPVEIREGTLSVAPGALSGDVTPAVQVAVGAVWQLRETLSVAGATVSGAGTIRGGTLVEPTIAGVWTESGAGAAPTFDGTVLSGRVNVDFGRTPETPFTQHPKGLVVARGVTGTPVFRATGLDGNTAVVFRQVGGVVTCDVTSKGLILIYR